MKFYELALHRGSASIRRGSVWVRDLAVYMASPLLIENFAIPGICNFLLLLLFCVYITWFLGILDIGGFHLHLLSLPFVYQFNSRIGILVCSSFVK